MRFFILFFFFIFGLIEAQELKIKADMFDADEKSGVSVFSGNVNIMKGDDELNASKVTVFINTERQPTKYIAEGDVSFSISTKKGAIYKGVAQKVIFAPLSKEYYFYKNVHLRQIDETKEIIGDEVVLKTLDGKAHAKGAKSEPVMMIFKMPKDQE